MEDDIHVAAACDGRYAMPLAVMLASVSANLGTGRRVVAHVLESGLDSATREDITRSIRDDRIGIRWITVAPDRLIRQRETLRSFDTVSVASYYRLLLPEALPDDLTRVIYLDCDLVVNHDLQDLWVADIGGTCLGAVPELLREARYASARAGMRLHRELGLRPDLELFNSGVMLIDLTRWRQEHVASRAITYLREAAPYLRWHDQEALNAVIAGDWTPLDPRWNVTMHAFGGRQDDRTRELVRAPFILHYNSAIKPWHVDFRLGGAELFYRYLDETAWRDWRPPRRSNAALHRWVARLVRAGRKRRHAVVRRLRLSRARFAGRRTLRRLPTRLAGRAVPETQTSEIRAFIVAAQASDAVSAVEYNLAIGADRVLLAMPRADEQISRMADALSDRLHVFLQPADPDARYETIRQLLHHHGRRHWCVVVDAAERLVHWLPGADSLGDLRDHLEKGGYEALECEILDEDCGSSNPQPRHRRLRVTLSDPLKSRVFCADACAGTSDRRVAEFECLSKIVMLRYRDDLVIDREFRGVQCARVTDVRGVVVRRSPVARGA